MFVFSFVCYVGFVLIQFIFMAVISCSQIWMEPCKYQSSFTWKSQFSIRQSPLRLSALSLFISKNLLFFSLKSVSQFLLDFARVAEYPGMTASVLASYRSGVGYFSRKSTRDFLDQLCLDSGFNPANDFQLPPMGVTGKMISEKYPMFVYKGHGKNGAIWVIKPVFQHYIKTFLESYLIPESFYESFLIAVNQFAWDTEVDWHGEFLGYFEGDEDKAEDYLLSKLKEYGWGIDNQKFLT